LAPTRDGPGQRAMVSLMQHEPALSPSAQMDKVMRCDVPIARELHEVWEANFEEEFAALLAAYSFAGGPDAILALDMEFPGFPLADPQFSAHAAHHQALCHNVDQLWPIQLGVAVIGGSDGVHRGVWTFNLRFDAGVDGHTQEALDFLERAGLDFPRHRKEGINALELGQRLKNSNLVGAHGRAPCWLTFSGSYDWGYLLKLLTSGRPLPGLASTFDKVLSVYCPRRRELRDLLPNGSLEALGRRHGVKRWGAAHTAGSDALLTLELFMLLGGAKRTSVASAKSDGPALFDTRGLYVEPGWGDNTEEWRDGDQWWGAGDTFGLSESGLQVASAGWENSNWMPPAQAYNHWFSQSMGPSSPPWYSPQYSSPSPAHGYSMPYFASL